MNTQKESCVEEIINPALLAVFLRERPYNDSNSLGMCYIRDGIGSYSGQVTSIFLNDHGDRLYIANNIGWDNPLWSDINSESIVDSVIQLGWERAVIAEVSIKDELAFAKVLRSAVTDNILSIDFIVVRVRIGSDNVQSWFYIGGPPNINTIAASIRGSLNIKIKVTTNHQVFTSLKKAFTYRMHPNVRNSDRWYIPPLTMEKLRLIRLKRLAEMARNQEELTLCQGLSPDTSFETRMACYLYSDVPLYCDLSPYDLTLLAEQVGNATDIEIAGIQSEIGNLYDEARKSWEHIGYCTSFPSYCVESAKHSDKFSIVKSYPLWALCQRKTALA